MPRISLDTMPETAGPRGESHPRTALVTGSTSGIGLAIAKGLAEHGYRVLMHARNEERGALPLAQAREAGADIDLITGDLAVQDDVRRMGHEVLRRYPVLDVLVHNAGVYHPQRKVTPDGIEETFAVNHLAPFLLTRIVQPALERAVEVHGEARIVTVASSANLVARFEPSDPEMARRRYVGWSQYANSKLMNILWTRRLAVTLPDGITANTYHPGAVRTGLPRDTRFVALLFDAFGISTEKGADTGIWLATDPALRGESGGHYARRRAGLRAPAAKDDELAEALWVRSEGYVSEP